MNITRGKIQKAKKVVIYGPEGIGKSTFASQFPSPVFIDTEGSTNGMDIARTDKPTSWELLKSYVNELAKSGEFKTIVIDTIDWAEQLCINSICSAHQKKGIEDFGYGNGYVYEKEEIGKFLNMLQDVVDMGINVVLTAHAQLRKFEQPDEMGAYDRWELKLGKKTSSQISPLVKEWADMVLFANYKTFSVASETDKDGKGKKFKGQGGERVMYTSHHPCWDAKNREGLPAEMPFSYQGIAHLFGNITAPQTAPAAPKAQPEPAPAPEPEPAPAPNHVPAKEQPAQEPTFADLNIPEALPQALKDLMRQYKVDESDIRLAVSQRGYFPYETPVTNYPEDFIKGCMVAAWSQLYEKYIKPNQGVPF